MLVTPGYALDIDDTLSHTAHDRFQELEGIFGNPGFEFNDIYKHHPRVNHVRENTDGFHEWMHNKMAHGEHWKKVSCYPGAQEYVNKLQTLKSFFSCYVTARPESVQEASLFRLKTNNFPNLPVVSKPTHLPHNQEYIWKTSLLYDMYAQGVRGIIDDQPKLLYNMQELYPKYKGTIHLLIHPDILVDTNNISLSYSISHSREEVSEKLLAEKHGL